MRAARQCAVAHYGGSRLDLRVLLPREASHELSDQRRFRYSSHSGCSTRTLSGPASRDAALRRSSAWRLVELKRAYDPTNFFRLNQYIEP